MAGRRAGSLRLLVVVVLMVTAWAGIGFRLFQLQIVKAAELKELGVEQRLKVRELAPERGSIFDRSGRELAVTIEGATVGADTTQVVRPEDTAALLAGTLRVDEQTVLDKLTGDRRWVTIARQVAPDLGDEVRRLDIPGIYIYPEPKRVYPEGSLAAQVLGFVDPDGKGLEGLEYRYNDELSGIPGELRVETDLSGRVIPQGQYEVRPAIPGSDLVTTIDRDIQYIAERECAAAVQSSEAERCTAVVLDPRTGEVLALAVQPGFDPNDHTAAPAERWVDWAVLGTYEPGSTQKLITVSAALEEHVVNWNTTFEVPDQIEVVEGACSGGEDYGCYRDFNRHDPATWSVKDIVTKSSNVGTILIQQELGRRALAEYIAKFGLGSKTGVDAPGEAEGIINLDPTCGPCFSSAAIGYSVSVTPLQMAAAYGAVANDGVWVQPHLVSEIVDGSGTRAPIEPATRQVISADTAQLMRFLLRNVVEEGTGHNAAVPGYSVGGKTGTARKNVPGVGYTDDFIVSFIGMAPIENPRIIVAVVVDSPQIGDTGGTVAAPVFSRIAEDTLHHLGVPPDAP